VGTDSSGPFARASSLRNAHPSAYAVRALGEIPVAVETVQGGIPALHAAAAPHNVARRNSV